MTAPEASSTGTTNVFRDRVRVTIANHVAEVALIRADKANALDTEMFAAIGEAGESLKGNRDIRAVVLYGEGKHFCAGLDLSRFGGESGSNEAFRERAFSLAQGEIANGAQKPSYVWKEIEVPVIAALQGVAFGGGCQIALGADIRIATPDARLSIMEIKWGLVPDMGVTASLPRLVRMDIAKDLVFTGRIVGAEEAQRIGLVTRIAEDPLAAAREAAAFIATRNPAAIRADKTLLESSWLASPADGLRLEAELQAGIIGMPNQKEAVRAEMEKRTPNFE